MDNFWKFVFKNIRVYSCVFVYICVKKIFTAVRVLK